MTAPRPGRLAAIGASLFVAGLLWGAFFAGVPYQDASPEQEAAHALHLSISSGLAAIGALLVAASTILAVLGWLRRR